MTLLGLADGIEVVAAAAADGEQGLRRSCGDTRSGRRPARPAACPASTGVEATRRIRAVSTRSTEVVILTTYTDDASILEALEAGARGYLTKDAGRAQIALALRAARRRAGRARSRRAAAAAGPRPPPASYPPAAPEPSPDGLTAASSRSSR